VAEEGKAAEAKAGELVEAGSVAEESAAGDAAVGAAVAVEVIRDTGVAERCSTMRCIWRGTI
jgi:hypothetical protein